MDLNYTSVSGPTGHPDLDGNQWIRTPDDQDDYLNDLCGWDFHNGDNLPADDATPGHGTNVAGIIAGVTNNNTGIAGIAGGWYPGQAGCKILPVKVTNPGDRACIDCLNRVWDLRRVGDGVKYADAHGARVINMSLGEYHQCVYTATQTLLAYVHGRVLVAAAHNYEEDPTFPAAWPWVIAVGALNFSDPPQRAYGGLTAHYPCSQELQICGDFDANNCSYNYYAANPCLYNWPGYCWGSNFGYPIDIVAPGLHIWTTDRSGDDGAPGDYLASCTQ